MTSFDFLMPLNVQPVIHEAATPEVGTAQPYNASSGALAPTLEALSGVTDNSCVAASKDRNDNSSNPVTVTCAGTDTFDDGTTTFVLSAAGDQVELQAATIDGVGRVWKILRGNSGSGSGLTMAEADARYPQIGNMAAPTLVLAGQGVPTDGVGYDGAYFDDVSTINQGYVTRYGPKGNLLAGGTNPGHWDQTLTTTLLVKVLTWNIADRGWRFCTVPPELVNSGVSPTTAGTVYTARMKWPEAINVGDTLNISDYIFTGGSGATALANCYIGVYDATTRGLIVASADQSTSWANPGQKDYSLTAAAAKPAGRDVLVAHLVGTQATTPVQIGRMGNTTSAQVYNGRGYISNPIWARANTGVSALPATLAAGTNDANMIFVGRY